MRTTTSRRTRPGVRARRRRTRHSPCSRTRRAPRADGMEALATDLVLAMAQASRNTARSAKTTGRTAAKRKGKSGAKGGLPAPRRERAGVNTRPANRDLAKLLSPKNLQESLKTVGTLRNFVKNGLNYLQQADRLLDTLYVTSNSLRESGVLDKIIKNRGKNLNTEDFTNILMAFLNSPLGSRVLKEGDGGGKSDGGQGNTVSPASQTGPASPAQTHPGAPPYPGSPPYGRGPDARS
ncbi:hypothetical protein [Alicyclobacillus kakegawensis]|uniref:hypothetical protein n=1 Tax=Alicyclobacillus kakegawensis TaxID=392012 RepID=UPI0008330CB8|nr:hypothetical protein [Alicyclobacillus kakegawensis]